MSPWQAVILVSGAVIELVGLVLTGLGLLYTWRDHANGERFMPALKTELVDLLRRLLRRPREIHISVGSAVGIADIAGFGHGSVPLQADAPLDEKLAQLKREVDAASLTASKALNEADRLKRHHERTTARIDEDIRNLRGHVDERLRDQTLHGLPLAVFGLALAVFGTALQAGSTFL